MKQPKLLCREGHLQHLDTYGTQICAPKLSTHDSGWLHTETLKNAKKYGSAAATPAAARLPGQRQPERPETKAEWWTREIPEDRCNQHV